jgi:hypothetical protein
MTNYEAWRISYQSSEQAARAAFSDLVVERERVARLFAREYQDVILTGAEVAQIIRERK